MKDSRLMKVVDEGTEVCRSSRHKAVSRGVVMAEPPNRGEN